MQQREETESDQGNCQSDRQQLQFATWRLKFAQITANAADSRFSNWARLKNRRAFPNREVLRFFFCLALVWKHSSRTWRHGVAWLLWRSVLHEIKMNPHVIGG